MITRILAYFAVALAAVALGVAAHGNQNHGASPSRVAGEYIKGLAASNNVTLIGDKVWSVRTHGDVTVVVVRVRYSQVPTILGVAIGPPQVGVTTIVVRELRSDYAVIP